MYDPADCFSKYIPTSAGWGEPIVKGRFRTVEMAIRELKKIAAMAEVYYGSIAPHINEEAVREWYYDGSWDTPHLQYEDGSFAEW